jgi:hypothetical protein
VAAEGTLAGSVSSEGSRAVAAEGTLAGSVSSEGSRAIAADDTLAGSVSAEGARAAAAEESLLNYVNSFMKGDSVASTFKANEFETVALNATLATFAAVNTGTILTVSAGTYSDARLKKDVEDVTDATAKVNALHPVFYNWNDKPSFNGTDKELGFLAQEVEAVLPNVVRTLDDAMGTKVVAYDRLVSLLVAALKEHDARISALEKN